MDDIEEELRAASESIKRLDGRREGQMHYRDDVVLRAIAAGVTWARVQEITGFTPRGVQQALKRARTYHAET